MEKILEKMENNENTVEKVSKLDNSTNYNSPIYNTVRYSAVKILSRFDRSDAYIDKLVNKALSSGEFNKQDKSLLTELVNGVVRWRNKLDWVLTGFYHGDFQKCLNVVKNTLRVALYQIMFLDKIPNHAAINEAVEVVKFIQSQKTADIVNGVLRNIARNLENVRYPVKESDIVYYLSVVQSHPKWMVRRWVDRFGAVNAEKLLQFNNFKPLIPIRINKLRANKEDILDLFAKYKIEHFVSPYLSNTIMVKSPRFDLKESEIFLEGKITIQDTSASLAATLANAKPGNRVIDLCAAPGGKSFLLAEQMQNTGKVIAIDRHQSKLRFIEEGSVRLGLTIIRTMYEDASSIDFDEPFDIVFADVPCSGLGTLQKKPDIRWKRQNDEIRQLALLQQKIMLNAAKLVRPNGVLIYSTCTIEPEENEENINWFLETHPEFELENAENYLPKEVCENGFMKTYPHIHKTDGAFAARLKRIK